MNYEVITVKDFKARASFFINEMRNGKIFEVNHVRIGNVQLLNQCSPELDHLDVDYIETTKPKVVHTKKASVKAEVANVDYIEGDENTGFCQTCKHSYTTMKIYKDNVFCRDCYLSICPKGSFYDLADA